MADLYLHKHKLESVFELLGAKENDITYSIGWALAHSPVLLDGVVRSLFPETKNEEVLEIRLQEHKRHGGITDIEILGPNIHAIIEAKRGWTLPAGKQLSRYAERLAESQCAHRVLAAMSECSHKYVEHCGFSHSVGGMSVRFLNWKDIDRLARTHKGSHAEKRLLAQLRSYLRRIVHMQNQQSNMVFVVALGWDRPEGSKLTFQEIVTNKGRYFHPFGKGWPKEPPNYIGFRYGAQLQRIHHVDSWKIVTEMHTDIPEIEPGEWGKYFLYTLGKPIIPAKTVKTGRIYPSGRKWAMLDLLLTCDTISQAAEMTRKRLSEE